MTRPANANAGLETKSLILDACVVINLYSTGRMEEIIAAQSAPVCTTKRIRRDEALVVGHSKESEDETTLELVDLESMIAAGSLTILEVRGELENDSLILFARDLDDGEAECGAIAVNREMVVVTDDKKAIRIFTNHQPRVRLMRTSQILFNWAARREPGDAVVRDTLQAIRHRARFEPPVADPLHDWWFSKSA